jgi:membrane fusion protein, copper/silver efflux system
MRDTRQAARFVTVAALVLVVIALVAGCGRGAPQDLKYQCPMHPTYISDKPGDCPICGMRLVPIETRAAPTVVAAYVCPMHPQVTSDKPGRCPECGMSLVPAVQGREAPEGEPAVAQVAERLPAGEAQPTTAPAAGRRVLFYRNPMNPKITSPVPMKDEMGMDYVPVYADEAAPSPTIRKILFYRNPMNPKITSPVPMKDEMGMDYVPVYAEEASGREAGVPGLAAVQVNAEGLLLAGVQTEPAVRERIAHTIRTVGSVTADETRIRHVHTKIAGWVEKLYINFTGQQVRAGEPILSLYSPVLLASQEEFLQAREVAARFASSAIPEVRSGGDDLVSAARRRLRLFDVPESFIEELERTGKPQRTVTLLAPVSGFVTTKGTFEGQQVEPGMELFTITDLSRVWIEADFYEYEARDLRLGEEANFSLPYEPGAVLTGRIAYIYPTLNPEARTVRVRFDFPNPGLALKPGMFANVELAVRGHEGIVIPASAVIDTGERQVVFVSLGGGRFAPRQVTLGARGGGKAEVLSGVAAGEQVVVRANFLLDSESQLRSAIAGASAKPERGPQ